MARPTETRFGSFASTTGVAVHADGWWFKRATDVVLEPPPGWRDLANATGATAAVEAIPVPPILDCAWLRRELPVCLQMSPSDAHAPAIGFVALQSEPSLVADAAYPFILAERDARLLVGFSGSGPPQAIVERIIRAFCLRLLTPAA